MKNQPLPAASAVPGLAKSNIQEIMQIERDYLRQRSTVDRLSDTISRFAGSLFFIIAHVVALAAWVAVNSNVVPGVDPFDPYPFGLLALIVTVEVIFLSTFVLMSQNRQARQEDHWAHLNLQIGLLAEQETTKILQMLRTVCVRLGLDQVRDAELAEMIGKTSIGELAEELAEDLERTRDQEQPLPGGR